MCDLEVVRIYSKDVYTTGVDVILKVKFGKIHNGCVKNNKKSRRGIRRYKEQQRSNHSK